MVWLALSFSNSMCLCECECKRECVYMPIIPVQQFFLTLMLICQLCMCVCVGLSFHCLPARFSFGCYFNFFLFLILFHCIPYINKYAYPLSRFFFFTPFSSRSTQFVVLFYSSRRYISIKLQHSTFDNLFRVTYRKIEIHAIDLSTAFLSHLHCTYYIHLYGTQIEWSIGVRSRRKESMQAKEKVKYAQWAFSAQLSSPTMFNLKVLPQWRKSVFLCCNRPMQLKQRQQANTHAFMLILHGWTMANIWIPC